MLTNVAGNGSSSSKAVYRSLSESQRSSSCLSMYFPLAIEENFWLTLSSWPENTRWLTEEEREMAQYRVLLSNGGKVEQVGGTWDGLKAAIRDPFTWMFCGMHFSLINAQSFKDFFPSVSLSTIARHAA